MNVKDVAVESIQVGQRFRKDLGDVEALAKSIDVLGLLQPIGVTTAGTLVFGERRLAAAKRLGLAQIPCHVLDISNILDGERAENECRKDMTISERVALADAIRAAVERLRDRLPGKGAHVGTLGKTRDIAADRVGLSHSTLERAEKAVEKGTPELVQAMDAGEVTIAVAAKLADLPKEEQMKAVKAGKKAVKEAVKPKPEEPNELGGVRDRITAVVKHETKNKPAHYRSFVADLLQQLAENLLDGGELWN